MFQDAGLGNLLFYVVRASVECKESKVQPARDVREMRNWRGKLVPAVVVGFVG